MRALNIHFPDDIVIESQKAAKSLGLTTTAFIRNAVIHELENFKSDIETINIIKSFDAMKKSKEYMSEIEDLFEDLSDDLPVEKEEWWKQV